MTFKPVTLEWGGKSYKIEPKRVMPAIALVEEIVSLNELSLWSLGRKDANLSKLARAYSSLLGYAGCEDATWEEVYQHLFLKDQEGRRESTQAIFGLLSLMVPPTHLQEDGADDKSPAKKGSGRKGSSKQHTSSPADQQT